jgi:hypothetical protein
MSKKPKSAAPESASVAEVLRPDMEPKVAASHAISPLMCFLAAAGAGAMTLTMLGYTAAVSVWALAELMGLPHWAFYGLLALAAIPVLWTALWVAGRAWHVEQLISRDQDVDTPVFSLGRYWGRR